MAFDFLGALRRAFTLPRSSNSLSDVLGKDIADAISSIVHTRIADAATQAFAQLAAGADKGAAHIVDYVSTFVTHSIGNVSPALAGQVNSAVAAAVGNAEGVLLSEVAVLAAKVTAEVGKVLKV